MDLSQYPCQKRCFLASERMEFRRVEAKSVPYGETGQGKAEVKKMHVEPRGSDTRTRATQLEVSNQEVLVNHWLYDDQ